MTNMSDRFIVTPGDSQSIRHFRNTDILEESRVARGVDGYRANTRYRSRRRDAEYMETLAAVQNFWADYREGAVSDLLMREAVGITQEPFVRRELMRQYPELFNEAMTSSDFQSWSDDMLDRNVLTEWQHQEVDFSGIAKIRRDIKDFRTIRAYKMDGGLAHPQEVAELEHFKYDMRTQSYLDYTVTKRLKGFAHSWEMTVNDDLSLLTGFPRLIAKSFRLGWQKWVTEKFVDVNGPLATFFTAGNGNRIPNNPVFSYDSLIAGLGLFTKFKDSDGNPVDLGGGVTLMVGSWDLLMEARRIKNMLTATKASGTHTLESNNFVAELFEIVYNPWIPLVASTANGNTSWFLFKSPSVGNPAMELGFLRGYDTPILYKRAANAIRIGGGEDSTGDFDLGATDYKGLMVYGGRMVEVTSAVASNGSGA
jgi:hypothetical protein